MALFLFKKIVSKFFFPLSLVIISLFITLFFILSKRQKRWGRWGLIFSILLLLFFSFNPTANFLLGSLENRYSAFELKKTNYRDVEFIVVLSGGHKFNKKIPVVSQIGEVTLQRLIEGIRIHKIFPKSKLLVSGGKVFSAVSSAKIMEKVAISIGVDKKDILLESKSRDTKDQARIIKKMVGKKRFILVTSASHMFRSMMLFKKVGLEPIPAPAGYRSFSDENFSIDYFVPSAGAISKCRYAFYEYMGILWGNLRGII